MSVFVIDVHDSTTADVEVIKILAEARKLLMNQPALDFLTRANWEFALAKLTYMCSVE